MEDEKAAIDQTMYIGTTQVAINRSSATLNLAGIGTLGVGAITSSGHFLSTRGSSNTYLRSNNVGFVGFGANTSVGTGISVLMYGESHATLPNIYKIRIDGTDKYILDASGNHDFKAGSITTTSIIQATTVKLTNLTDGFIPYHVSDASGLANSIISQSGGVISIGGHISITGTGNSVFIGEDAGLNDDLTDNWNVFIGYNAGKLNTSGLENISIGAFALDANTIGISNIAIGHHSMGVNIDGIRNIGIGVSSLDANTDGINNTAIGYASLSANVSGINNTAIGYYSFIYKVGGDFNTALGAFSGNYYGASTDHLIESTSSIFIGYDSRANANSETNQIVIGVNAIGNGSNTATLGDDNITDVYMNEDGTATVHAANVMLSGMLMPFAGSSAPTGYLLCDGSAVSRSTYAALFAVIGTTYGVGDGSTTFNVPDLRGRLPLGKDNMGGVSADRVTDASADDLGGSGGSESIQLSENNMPSHIHDADIDAATVTVKASSINGTKALPSSKANIFSGVTAGLMYGEVDPDVDMNVGGGDVVGTVTVDPTGGDEAFSKMNPYLTINYIIKY